MHAEGKRTITLPAQPRPVELDLQKTAVLVVDMQNDMVSKGGLMDRDGVDVTSIQKTVGPIRSTIEAARRAGLPIVFIKTGYRADLSDLVGPEDSPYREECKRVHVGEKVRTPDGREGRILVRDTWNTDIVNALQPRSDDIVVYKKRFSAFYKTDLDAILRRRGIRTLIVTGCTTSVCVESTIRDATFRDYSPVLLSDCTAEPVGQEFTRSNHDASLYLIQTLFGWVANSGEFIGALESPKR